jgi:hypothetical protein
VLHAHLLGLVHLHSAAVVHLPVPKAQHLLHPGIVPMVLVILELEFVARVQVRRCR